MKLKQDDYLKEIFAVVAVMSTVVYVVQRASLDRKCSCDLMQVRIKLRKRS